MMVKPRWFAHLLAHLGGYFWLPCPVCREPFAGFEWTSGTIMSTEISGTGVCSKPACIAEAHCRNKKNGLASWERIGEWDRET